MFNIRQSNLSFRNQISEWKVPVLSADEIHIWFGDLDEQFKNIAVYRSYLSPSEIQEAQFFIGQKLQDKFIICRGLIRLFLSQYSGIQSEKIRLSRNHLDKPEWKNQEIKFNLTHSGNLFGVAFSRNHELGLDLEMIRNLDDFNQLILFNFTEKEQHYILENPNLSTERFFNFWTIKESYMKLTGAGMRINPRSLEIFVDENNVWLNSINGKNNSEKIIFKSINVANSCKSTIAYYNEHLKINTYLIP